MSLSPADRARYEWQLWIPDLGEAGQEKLCAARVLVTRVGGVGGAAAYQLAAAGIGTLILAHAGNLRPSDLNRQILMSHAALGTARVQAAADRLAAFNPTIRIEAIAENAGPDNAERLVRDVDLVLSAAPMFQERLALNAECVRQRKPMIDCAMFEMTGQVTTILPGRTACLACRVPEVPPLWKRQFPVLGAVAGTIACLGAIEAVKCIAGLGEPLANRLLMMDAREMRFRTVHLARRVGCAVCGEL